MNRLLNAYCRLLDFVIACCLAIMVVLVFGNVVLRYVFNSGVMVSEEMSRWFFVWMIFIGAVSALHENDHLGTDFLVGRLPPIGKRICAVLSLAGMIYTSWLLIRGTITQVQINASVTAPVSGASMGIFYASGIFFGASALVILSVQLWRTVTGQVKDDELVMITESEDLARAQAHGDAGEPLLKA